MINNRYNILKIIGEGSYSSVYLALDVFFNTFVALKSIKKRSKNFNEIKIAKSLKHENIVNLIDSFEENDQIYIVYELCDYNLISFINEYELEIKNILKIIRMILLGIKSMHDNKIIHRDIKMSNILVKNDVIKICDFGLSCFEDENDFSYCGTLDYLAPEIIKIKKNDKNINFYDKKIDIYAVGIIFKYLICKNKMCTLEDINIDEDIKNFIGDLLNKSPDKRIDVDIAIQNKTFDSLFLKIPDFRKIKNFKKETKYGIITKYNNYIQIDYIYNNKNNILNIECNSTCYCNNKMSFIIKLNNNLIKTYYLNNTDLKYYNYLCGFLNIIRNKTLIKNIKNDQYHFQYFLSKNFIYSTQDLEIEYFHDKNFFFINNVKFIDLPDELKNLKKFIFNLINKNNKENNLNCIICKNENECTGNFNSIIDLSIKDNFLINNKIFIENLGWVIKEKLKFIFLLNDGKFFNINFMNDTININGCNLPLTQGLPNDVINYLKIGKKFLDKYVKNVYN